MKMLRVLLVLFGMILFLLFSCTADVSRVEKDNERNNPKDPGGTSYSSSSTPAAPGEQWLCAASAAAFTPRYYHKGVVFNNAMWIVGGSSGGSNDIWYSKDGTNWLLATGAPPYGPRYHHTCLVYNNAMWVIGGMVSISSTTAMSSNDVWYSRDGTNWSCATRRAAFSPRAAQSGAVFNNKMWIIGGNNSDAWYSSDGTNWTLATGSIGNNKTFHTSLAFNNAIWNIDGWTTTYSNDISYSEDGINWFQATPAAGFFGRTKQASFVCNSAMWVIAGECSNQNGKYYTNDVWNSTDGTNWNLVLASAEFSGRFGSVGLVYNGAMWIIGGYSVSGRKNDVWYSK